MPLFYVAAWRTFKTGCTHYVLPMPAPFDGKRLRLHPSASNCAFLEDYASWYSDPIVWNTDGDPGFMQYGYHPRGTEPNSPVGQITVRHIEKKCRLYAVLGGPGPTLVLNFTVQFAEDHASVVQKLRSQYTAWDQLIGSNELSETHRNELWLSTGADGTPSCSTAQMHDAMVVACRLIAFRFGIPGGPIDVPTEPSGITSTPWEEGHEAWHASPTFIIDYSKYTCSGAQQLHRTLVSYAKSFGLVPKQMMRCGHHRPPV